MKRYDEKMLNLLLDRYEGSLLYSGKNQVNISIFVPVQKRTLPEYFDEAALQFDVIHEQLEALEEKGYIRLIWKNRKKGHILEKCELVVEKADEIYRLLHRKPRQKKEQEIELICRQYQGKAKELDQFLAWIQERIHAGESVRRYVDLDETEEFAQLCELIYRILTNDEECFLRQFSIRCFHDSKTVEKHMEKAVHVISEFSEEERLQGVQTDELLEEYNIYRNPSWVMMKGYGMFRKNRDSEASEVDLNKFPGGIGLSNQDIGELCWNRQRKPEKILTIENLTSFHQWKLENSESVLCIYLGGYHNRSKRLFLKHLYETYPDAEYYHFGDIDCGGFCIWKDLCAKTGIPFKTIRMDLQTYDKYLKWGRRLTDRDKKVLKEMGKDPFFSGQRELFEKMLKEDMKLEQECIVV